jgi:hypothetical protein
MIPQITESLDPTFGGFVLVMVVFNLAWYLTIRHLGGWNAAGNGRENDASAGTDGGSDADVDVDAGTVRCRECRTENERDYRYCRACVSTLPTAEGAAQVGNPSFGRLVR